MNVERLKMWRDALVEADKKGRVFDMSMWIRRNAESPCGFAACAGGDLALYGPAQDLGMGFNGGTCITFSDAPTFDDPEYGSGAICAFLGIEVTRVERLVSQDEIWVRNTTSASNEGGVYRDPNGRALLGGRVTRAMVLARIEAKIAEIER
jgi:hypothetical protein